MEFVEDDAIGQVQDVCDAYVQLTRAQADRSRMEGEVCKECGEEVEDIFDNGEPVVTDDPTEWSVCWCYGCWSDWAAGEAAFIPLFQPASGYTNHMGIEYCDYCDESLTSHAYTDEAWFAYDEDGNVACHQCWVDWATDCNTCEECEVCEVCEVQLDGWPKVTDGDGTVYCTDCWFWEDEVANEPTATTSEPAAKEARVGDASKRSDDAAGRARNERDKAKLRARYKSHCAYHLFHAHHRKHQGCTFAAAGQDHCSRGSHGIPDDFEDAQAELETPARL